MPYTPNEKDQPQQAGNNQDASTSSTSGDDASGKSHGLSFRSLILTSKGTREIEGNDPVTEEQGAKVDVVYVDKTGYTIDSASSSK